jgi:ketosteroid isomerase-like protein
MTPTLLIAVALVQPADAKAEMMAADKAFAKVTAEKGLDGWMSFMADDVAKTPKFGEKIVTGKEAVRKVDAKIFADQKARLVWEPVDAHAFEGGTTGLTTGRYKVVATTDDGKTEARSTGAYVTWWRKGKDGWKVIYDTGTPDPPAKK